VRQYPHLRGVIGSGGNQGAVEAAVGMRHSQKRWGTKGRESSPYGNMEPLVIVRSANGVGRLTFNRPDQRNAMSAQMLELFHEKLQELDAEPEIRCIVIDGAGGNFVAGGDIKAWAQLKGKSPSERSEDFEARLRTALPAATLIDSIEKPLIAAVRGYSIGAGVSFVLGADFVIADQTATLVFAHIRMGLVPDMGLTYYLPRVVGERRALQLALLGSQVDAVRAKELGLFDEVVAPEALEDAVAGLAAKIIAAPARAAAETKRLLRLSRHNSFVAQFNAEIEGAASCVGDEDFMEAVTAFTERRLAKFGPRP
jgi:2-(1,2-epoxy-1,2-dihydrophenyl)acetyl-CoA isomerase